VDPAILVAIPLAAYLVIAVLVALDAAIPAVPSELFVVSSGAFAASGELSVVWAVVAAAAGAWAGDHAVYGLGRHKPPTALDRSRLGRRAHRVVDRTYDRLGPANAATSGAGRFLPLGRTASAASAGLAGVPPRRFLVWSAVGSTAWASWLVGLGYVTGTATEAPLWLQSLIGAGVALIVGVWAAAVHAMLRTRRRLSTFGGARPPAALAARANRSAA
jgi:membrane-associated protein